MKSRVIWKECVDDVNESAHIDAVASGISCDKLAAGPAIPNGISFASAAPLEGEWG